MIYIKSGITDSVMLFAGNACYSLALKIQPLPSFLNFGHFVTSNRKLASLPFIWSRSGRSLAQGNKPGGKKGRKERKYIFTKVCTHTYGHVQQQQNQQNVSRHPRAGFVSRRTTELTPAGLAASISRDH